MVLFSGNFAKQDRGLFESACISGHRVAAKLTFADGQNMRVGGLGFKDFLSMTINVYEGEWRQSSVDDSCSVHRLVR